MGCELYLGVILLARLFCKKAVHLPDCCEKVVANRPFAGSGHMVQNKLYWDANNAVGLSKQRKVGLDWYEFFCSGSRTVLFASQHNLSRTMRPDRAKGPLSMYRTKVFEQEHFSRGNSPV